MKPTQFALTALVIAAMSSVVLAQTMPATSSTEQQLMARVEAVTGNVQARTGDNQPWQKAVVGMVVPVGGEFRTAPRSAVRFTIPGGQTITLDRLGTMKILTAIEQNGKITTNLGLKYGRTRYDIQKAGVEYSSTIRSPGSTLAIRGTDVIYEDQAPWVPNATSLQGRAEFQSMHGYFMAFGGVSKTSVDTHQGPGLLALGQSTEDPTGDFAGHSQTEQSLITDHQGLAGLGGFGHESVVTDLQSVHHGHVTNFPLLNGPLEFDLAWQSVNAGNGIVSPTDLNLAVTDPMGQSVSRDHPTVGSGLAIGTYSGNDLGASGAGAESVVWNRQFAQGTYQINVNDTTGDPAQAVLVVRRQHHEIKTIGLDPSSPLILTPGQTFTTSLDINADQNSGEEPETTRHGRLHRHK